MPRYAHLIVTAAPTAHRFMSTRSARQHFDTPQRNRPQHATRLIGQLGHATAQAGQTVQVGNGFYTVNDLTITVQSDPNFPLAFESLDLPASGINLLAVTRDAAGRTRANRELEIINEEWEKAPACEFVFTYEVRHGPDAGKRRPITVAGLRRATERAFKAAGLDDFRRHDFRHTFASRAGRALGGDLRALQAALDHQDIGSTAKYRHVVTSEVTRVRSAVADTVSRNSPGSVVIPFVESGGKA